MRPLQQFTSLIVLSPCSARSTPLAADLTAIARQANEFLQVNRRLLVVGADPADRAESPDRIRQHGVRWARAAERLLKLGEAIGPGREDQSDWLTSQTSRATSGTRRFRCVSLHLMGAGEERGRHLLQGCRLL